jgi:hypothetical protein
MRIAKAVLEPSEVQDLGDVIPRLLELKTKTKIPLTISVQIDVGDGKTEPSDSAVQKFNKILGGVAEKLKLQ